MLCVEYYKINIFFLIQSRLELRKGPPNIKGTNSILGNESMNAVPKYKYTIRNSQKKFLHENITVLY